MKHPVNVRHISDLSFGERAADKVASTIGSWRFLGAQASFMIAWAMINIVGIFKLHWDPYPFILLNLLLSTQAAFTGPILQLTQNRQAMKDRDTLEHAAAEADKMDLQNQQILKEIEHNTSVTLDILERVTGWVPPRSNG